MCSLIILKVWFNDVRMWIVLSKIRVSLSLFWNLISTEDLLVEIDYCLSYYKQSSDQDNLIVLTLITTRSY